MTIITSKGYKIKDTSNYIKAHQEGRTGGFKTGHKINVGKHWKVKDTSKMGKGMIGMTGEKHPMYGNKHRVESIRKMKKSHVGKHLGKKNGMFGLCGDKSPIKGEKNGMWKDGLSRNPYPSEFNKNLKRMIRKRDNFTCCLCARTEREELEEFNRVLCVNHIDFDKNNCSEKNLNSLCLKCNTKICRDRDYWTNYFQQNYE